MTELERCRASVTQQRLLGYVDALNAAGIDFETVPIYEIRINDDAEASYWSRRFLKRKRRRPTAIFSMSDRMAFGALHAATQLGLKVPRDLSIIGFDDIPQAAGSTPALTTVRQPFGRRGGWRRRLWLVIYRTPRNSNSFQQNWSCGNRSPLPEHQSARKDEEMDHGRSTLFPSLNDKGRPGSVRDISHATAPQRRFSHYTAQSAISLSRFSLPTLAGSPGETRQNKGNQK